MGGFKKSGGLNGVMGSWGRGRVVSNMIFSIEEGGGGWIGERERERERGL